MQLFHGRVLLWAGMAIPVESLAENPSVLIETFNDQMVHIMS